MVSNVEVARRLGVTRATVSLLRRGKRFPSPATMQMIEREFGWTAQDQFTAKLAGTFTSEFNHRLTICYQSVIAES